MLTFFMSTGEMELDGDPEDGEEEIWHSGDSNPLENESERFMCVKEDGEEMSENEDDDANEDQVNDLSGTNDEGDNISEEAESDEDNDDG